MFNQQFVARLSYREMTISAYKSYAANTGNKNFRGDEMPKWEDLPVSIQTAWEAATRQIVSIVDQDPEYRILPDEQSWNGWVRP
jgi:hypothetical protein